MKMRTMKSEQLSMAFADRPKGGQGEETLVLTREESSRLHTASNKEFEDFMAATADAGQLMERITSEINRIRLVNCASEWHKS